MADIMVMAVEFYDDLREFVKEFADAEALDAA